MKASKLFLILFVFTFNLFAQNIGDWKIYADFRDVKGAVVAGNNIWVATTGGVFRTGIQDTSFTLLSKADGLNSQSYYSIAKDADNKIWLGSKEGFINIYDPNTNSTDVIVDIYTYNKTQKQINNLFVKGDTVFASLDFGLSLISASKKSLMDSFLKFGNFSAETEVISTFKSNLIYVCTSLGIAIQKAGTTNLSAPESWDTYKFDSQIPVRSAKKFVSFNNSILLGTSGGVYKFQNNAWTKFALVDSSIIDLASSSSSLYIITKSQLYQYSNNQITKLYENTGCTFSSVYSTDQAIYISSDRGLVEYKNGSVKFILPNAPASNSFVNMSVGPDGKLWVATGKDVNGKGFFEFDGQKWNTYNKEKYPSIKSNAYYNVYAASDSAVYLGNWGDGATIFKNGKFEFFTTDNSGMVGVPEDNAFLVITDIKLDSKGNTWFMNYRSNVDKPLSVYTKDKSWVHFGFTSPLISTGERFDKLVIDQNDTKWFFSLEGARGVYYFNDNGTLTNSNDDTRGLITTSDGLSSDLISCLAVDRRNQIWIGTNVGINLIADVSRPKAITTTAGLAVRNQMVNCIAIDPIDQKWIGTNNGVFVLSSDGYQLIKYYDSKNSPLPDNNILSIAIDPNSGKVFIGTDYGLAELNTEFLQPKESFEEIFIYPNPFVTGNSATTSVTIDGLIRNSDIKILGISGDLIREMKSPGGRIAFWDGKDENGNLVPTGVYILVAYDQEANNVKTAKIAVIRK